MLKDVIFEIFVCVNRIRRISKADSRGHGSCFTLVLFHWMHRKPNSERKFFGIESFKRTFS